MALHWFMALVMIVFIIMVYIVGSWVIYSPDFGMWALANSTINDPGVNTTMAQGAMDTFGVMWPIWPWIAIAAIIVWGIAMSQKKEYDTGLY